jgi:lipopolysaccharide transport system ATP-binding protein
MDRSVIAVEQLSKKYLISHRAADSGLRHAIEEAVRSPWRWLRNRAGRDSASREEYWALRDIQFQVGSGEVVGLIGRNGAGKSTLLKVISRITPPSSGRVRLRGRIGSLLEVGTGFHPELTGRENVFLNGAILGMSRLEIKRKFDEIVAFSGVEKFIDTPVKRYSSGMYVRLAFAVAAHLEPEVLLVDEVLAVGDAEFQKKCLDKMDDVGQSGRTVLFVSHNMQAITRLCTRCILLDSGRIKLDGPPHEVANAYLNSGLGTSAAREWPDLKRAPGDDVVKLCAVRVRAEDGTVTDQIDIRRTVGVELEYEVLKPGYIFHPHFGLTNEDGTLLFVAQDVDAAWRQKKRPTGRYVSTGWIPGNLLAEGAMAVGVTLMTLQPETTHLDLRDAAVFRVVDCLSAADTARGDYPRPIPGVVRPLLHWTTEYTPRSAAVPVMAA